MAQSKVTKKSGRNNRNTRSAPTENASAPQRKEYPLALPANGGEKAPAPCSVPTLLTGPHNDTPEQADNRPTALVLIPQPVQAKAARKPSRKFGAMMGALLVSLCVIGGAIFSFGTSKTPGGGMQMAQAGTHALPITPAAESGQDAHGAAGAPASDKRTAAARVKRPEAKPTVTASKSGSSTPRTEKKSAQARPKPDTKRVADNAKKKPAATIANAPNKVSEDKPLPVLAQNSATQGSRSTGRASSSYAQCQELGSFFRREQCKWQACSGKWGQEGCPSYTSGDPVYN